MTVQILRKVNTISHIARMSVENSHSFFDKLTMDYFDDKLSNWKVFVMNDGNIFICSKIVGVIHQVSKNYKIGISLDNNGRMLTVHDKHEFNKIYPTLNGIDNSSHL